LKDYLNNISYTFVIDFNGVTNMNEIDEIKNRMNKRKGTQRKTLTDHHFLKFYNLMIKCMVLLLVVIAVFTYMKITPQGQYVQEHIFSRIHFHEAIAWINQQFYDFFPNDESTTTVSSTVSYQHIKDNLYTNQTNEVVNFSKGRVIYTGKQDLLGNYVTILLDNNIEVTFGKLTDVFVSSFDQVDKATIIGTCEENVLIVFTQGEKEIDYETFQKVLKEG